jgi:phospholipase/carboxylesterase
MLSAIIRRPTIPSDQPPLLVLLHGLGADEHDLMGLAPELDPRLLIVSIRAPLEYGYGGYAWFEIEWDVKGVHVIPDQALASRDLLIETLRGLPDALKVEAAQMLLGGFSQGAMMSLGVAFAAPSLISGVISMSGRLLSEFVPASPLPETAELPFLIQHGTSDGVLPVQGSRQLREHLEKMGCSVTYKEYPMAHEISRQSLADVRDWISERLP